MQHGVCHVVGRNRHIIKFDKVEIAVNFILFLMNHKPMKEKHIRP